MTGPACVWAAFICGWDGGRGAPPDEYRGSVWAGDDCYIFGGVDSVGRAKKGGPFVGAGRKAA
jgi:hypothetical protein